MINARKNIETMKKYQNLRTFLKLKKIKLQDIANVTGYSKSHISGVFLGFQNGSRPFWRSIQHIVENAGGDFFLIRQQDKIKF